MDKKKIIIILIAALVVTSIGGYIFLQMIAEKRYDFVLYSFDRVESFLVADVCSTKQERNMSYQAYRANLANVDLFFEESVRSRSSFLYSVDTLNRQQKTETGNYLFLENNHYYYVSVSGEFIYGAELVISIPYGNTGDAFVSFPFVKADGIVRGGYGYLTDTTTDTFTWEESPALNSFEDLVDFYSRISDFRFEQNDETQTILIPLLYWDENLNLAECSGKLQIQVADDAILVSYLESNV